MDQIKQKHEFLFVIPARVNWKASGQCLSGDSGQSSRFGLVDLTQNRCTMALSHWFPTEQLPLCLSRLSKSVPTQGYEFCSGFECPARDLGDLGKGTGLFQQPVPTMFLARWGWVPVRDSGDQFWWVREDGRHSSFWVLPEYYF